MCHYLLCLTWNVVFFSKYKRVSNNIIEHLSFHPSDNPVWFPRSYATLTLTASVFFQTSQRSTAGRCAHVLQRWLMIEVCDQRSWYLWHFCCSFTGSRCQIATVGDVRSSESPTSLAGTGAAHSSQSHRKTSHFPKSHCWLAGWPVARSVMEEVVPAGQTVVKVNGRTSSSEEHVLCLGCVHKVQN